MDDSRKPERKLSSTDIVVVFCKFTLAVVMTIICLSLVGYVLRHCIDLALRW
jgi:hypothetical protein